VSITVNCSIDLTEEELMYVLLSRAKLKAVPWTLPDYMDAAPEPIQPAQPIEEALTPEPETVPVEPPPLPPKPTRSRAKTNGAEAPINATPLAPPPPPEPLDEPAMRSLLSKVGAVHPLKVKAITNILENCGGHRRLSECDPVTWPTIAEEAQKVLAEYGA
jgi:hypothetical protein